MTTGRINQINKHVNDKSSLLRSLVTFEYLVSLIIKNNITVYPRNKAVLCRFSTSTMKPIKIKKIFGLRRKIRKYWNS